MGIIAQSTLKSHHNPNLALHWSNFDHNEIGAYGEYVARWSFFRGGLLVLPCRTRKNGDFRVLDPSTGESYLIEVKTAKRHVGKRSRWHFHLINNHTDINHADMVCLIVLDNDKHYTYLIPSCLFGNASHFSLSSHPTVYRGKFACFLQRQPWIDLQSCLATASLWSQSK